MTSSLLHKVDFLFPSQERKASVIKGAFIFKLFLIKVSLRIDLRSPFGQFPA